MWNFVSFIWAFFFFNSEVKHFRYIKRNSYYKLWTVTKSKDKIRSHWMSKLLIHNLTKDTWKKKRIQKKKNMETIIIIIERTTNDERRTTDKQINNKRSYKIQQWKSRKARETLPVSTSLWYTICSSLEFTKYYYTIYKYSEHNSVSIENILKIVSRHNVLLQLVTDRCHGFN